MMNLSLSSWTDGRAVRPQTKKKNEKGEEGDGEAGGVDEEQEGEEKVIFVHYEQRKVMLSQLHPTEVPDAGTDPPSELRQVGDRGDTGRSKCWFSDFYHVSHRKENQAEGSVFRMLLSKLVFLSYWSKKKNHRKEE